MKSIQNISNTSNSGYYNIKNLLQTNEVVSNKKVTVNVRSTGFTGINLRYVRGNYSQDGISIQKAVAMNAVISSFHSQQQGELQQYIQKIMDSDQDTSSKNTLILKKLSSLSKQNYSQKVLSMETVKGLVVDTIQ